jgi:predicted adenine nucleotide alpha hydrolase (AANH) superfamily ATPase
MMDRVYACIDLKSFYASCECRERGLDPITTNLVVADKERTEKLNSLGWKCLKRVRWSEFQKLSQDDKKVFCEDLISSFGS